MKARPSGGKLACGQGDKGRCLLCRDAVPTLPARRSREGASGHGDTGTRGDAQPRAHVSPCQRIPSLLKRPKGA